mmetsp:Transcript_13226/g.26865  ORF Transcript_13226/g.26865 Transcript_13226/m.26865 type:complete len:484 (+) Transcript_13226:115-1566(+)|eukprot:CAMPEP_0184689794 /NCGR_PEP_ID=MMETSP0312-20130426/30854_1 /TAXON_ID=31354 /ORGANISM="Compsopogon coeruleus, Strain SAG 36.94" /LENGTH=483 /DNA_ID=CAMNT_0027147183 /DNA_START=951 /DNA_END=2402 /DNA_ORIENTATION=-
MDIRRPLSQAPISPLGHLKGGEQRSDKVGGIFMGANEGKEVGRMGGGEEGYDRELELEGQGTIEEDTARVVSKVLAPRPYRVALLAWESRHTVCVGSVGSQVDGLAAQLVQRGHEVHIYARAPLQLTKGKMPGYEKLEGGIHLHRVDTTPRDDFAEELLILCNNMVHFLMETERFMNQPFDIIHAMDWVTGQALINIKMNHERKCVFGMHSTEPGRKFGREFGSLSAKMHVIEGDCLKLADRVIGTTGPLCDEIKSSYEFDASKVRCVPLAVDCEEFDGFEGLESEVREFLKVKPTDRIILFAAALDAMQGPTTVVDALPGVLHKYPDAKLVFAGAGPLETGLLRRADELMVRDAIVMAGPLPQGYLVELYKISEMVLIPSTKSGFSLQVLYAWASFTAPVISVSGGMRDLVWENHDCLKVDDNGPGFAWGINRLLDDPDHAKYLGREGRAKAAFSYSFSQIAMKTNDVYDELFGIFPPPTDP